MCHLHFFTHYCVNKSNRPDVKLPKWFPKKVIHSCRSKFEFGIEFNYCILRLSDDQIMYNRSIRVGSVTTSHISRAAHTIEICHVGTDTC